MQHALRSLGTATAVLALLAACASSRGGEGASGAEAAAPSSAQQRALARYSAYAGAPVQSFTWLGRFDSWEALGRDQLVVYTRPNEAYLLKIAPPCDLRFVVHTVGISSTNSSVYAGLDSIVVNDHGAGPWSCPIQEIRPLDIRRMKDDARSQNPPPPAQR